MRCCKPLTLSHPVGKWWYAILISKCLTTSEAWHSFMFNWPSVILLWTPNFVHFSSRFRYTADYFSVYCLLSLMIFWISKWIWGDLVSSAACLVLSRTMVWTYIQVTFYIISSLLLFFVEILYTACWEVMELSLGSPFHNHIGWLPIWFNTLYFYLFMSYYFN